MLIKIDPAVIDCEQEFRNLDRLLNLFEHEQHEWYVEEALEDIMGRAWAMNLSERHQKLLKEILEKSIVRSANISKKEKNQRGILLINTQENNSLTNRFASIDDPLYIIVENETSDSLFLKRLFEIYAESGKRLKNAYENSHLVFYPAGGRGETIKTIKNIYAKKRPPYSPRIFVFLDSDKKYPGEPDDVLLQNIKAYCNSNNIPIHVLFKREIENYIPIEVLRKKIPDFLRNVLDEFEKLDSNQKDFYDMEKGFNDRKPTEDKNPLFIEYAEKRNAEKYNNLKVGFHRAKSFIAKQELFRYFNDDGFNSKNADLRCTHQPDKNELVNLLINISNII